ncbi:Rci50 protein [Martiniozyma asiatica (nom. inval.)]|nr:Rci50 protein [Martiniozyma asiatica]
MFKHTQVLKQVLKTDKIAKYVPPSQRAIIEHENLRKEKKKNDRLAKVLQYGIGGLVATSFLLYLWQPWNPYSEIVSKDLRKGLWEERDKKEENNDYLTALKYYQKALQSGNEEGMDQLSMEYTGIVLKIAEMYQKLKMNDKLIDTYYKLSEFIFLNILENKRDIPQKELLIDRDLTVITRWAMLMEDEKSKEWYEKVQAELQDRMAYMENHEIPEKFPWLLSTDPKQTPDILELLAIWENPNLKDKWVDEKVPDQEGREFFKCWDILRSVRDKEWPLWFESYLRLRDYYSTLQLKNKNYRQSIQILQSNILWSVIGDFKEVIGSTQVINLAAAWFEYGQTINSKTAISQAETIYVKLVEILKKSGDSPNLAMAYYSLAVLYEQQKNDQQSDFYFEKAADVSLNLGISQILEKIDEHKVASHRADLLKKMQS